MQMYLHRQHSLIAFIQESLQRAGTVRNCRKMLIRLAGRDYDALSLKLLQPVLHGLGGWLCRTDFSDRFTAVRYRNRSTFPYVAQNF